MSVTPIFHLPLMDANQDQAEIPYNEAMAIIDDHLGGGGGGSDSGSDVASPIVIQLSASDLVTALTTGTGVGYVRSAQSFVIHEVRASLKTASSSGNVTVDVKKNGTSIFSTLLTIDATEKTSKTAATPAVISTSAVSDDDELSVDITGAGTGSTGLIVTIIGT